MCSHDEVSPFLHRPGGADLSVRHVGGDEAEQTLQQDLGAVVDVVLLSGQLGQVVLGAHTPSEEPTAEPTPPRLQLTLSQRYSPNFTPLMTCW